MKSKILLAALLLLAFALGVGFGHWYLHGSHASQTASVRSSMTLSFDDLSKLVIPGATSKDVTVECYDNSTPRKMINPLSVTVDSGSNVVVRFVGSTSGYCIAHNMK